MEQTRDETNETREAARIAARKRRFLDELACRGNVGKACRAAKVARCRVYVYRDEDPDFDTAWKLALEDSGDALEEEAWRRGVEGVERPVFQGGAEVGRIREYSDGLLTLLLKAAKPEKYREKTDVTSGGEKISVQVYIPDNGRG